MKEQELEKVAKRFRDLTEDEAKCCASATYFPKNKKYKVWVAEECEQDGRRTDYCRGNCGDCRYVFAVPYNLKSLGGRKK